MTLDERAVCEENRLSWNAATAAHESHRGDVAAFLRAGGSTLFPEELELLGDVAGCALVHLLCNTGQDTLSLARLGARVVGVDIGDTAIAAARRLAATTGIPARFVRMDVYDWLAETARGGERFDIAFCSYGALCWLADLTTWARGLATILKPGGRFVVVDFHPAAAMFDNDWRHAFPYGGGRMMSAPEGVGDYVGDARGGLTPAGFVEGVANFRNPHGCHLYQWGIGELVTALIDAGLTITALREHGYSNGERRFTGMRELDGRRMLPPASTPSLPLMFSLAARA